LRRKFVEQLNNIPKEEFDLVLKFNVDLVKACSEINSMISRAKKISKKFAFNGILIPILAGFVMIHSKDFDEAYNVINEVKERIQERENEFIKKN